jgi:hypothetical protein
VGVTPSKPEPIVKLAKPVRSSFTGVVEAVEPVVPAFDVEEDARNSDRSAPFTTPSPLRS